jgi:hypothetical protein
MTAAAASPACFRVERIAGALGAEILGLDLRRRSMP